MTSDRLAGCRPVYEPDLIELLRACCAIETRQAQEIHDEAMRQPALPPRTPADVALERCRLAGVLMEGQA